MGFQEKLKETVEMLVLIRTNACELNMVNVEEGRGEQLTAINNVSLDSFTFVIDQAIDILKNLEVENDEC